MSTSIVYLSFSAMILVILLNTNAVQSKQMTLYDTEDNELYDEVLERGDRASAEQWDGKWFPGTPEYIPGQHEELYDSIMTDKRSMGVVSDDCDNAITNLTLDFDGNVMNHKCFYLRYQFMPDSSVNPELTSDYIPKEYVAKHECMHVKIEYADRIPTFGTHRSLWPRYGTYTYVPPQRWLHSLEHGAIVMLFHPCADQSEVEKLQSLVRGCLWRHVITPYPKLTPKFPLALVSWGHRLEMSKVDANTVTNFIKDYALKGPEKKADDGQFTQLMTRPANVVSDPFDSSICPGSSSAQ